MRLEGDVVVKKADRRFELGIAGMGGQGALMAGRLLAEAGMHAFPYVTFFPNYATLMRGWPSESTTILSHEPIRCSFSFQLQSVILMHPRHLARYANRVKQNGMLILDSSFSWEKIDRDDIKLVHIPAANTATEMGNPQIANLILLGAYLGISQAVDLSSIEKALEARMRGIRWEALLPLNKDALKWGVDLADMGNTD